MNDGWGKKNKKINIAPVLVLVSGTIEWFWNCSFGSRNTENSTKKSEKNQYNTVGNSQRAVGKKELL